MKILCFIDNLGAGGAQRQLVGLSRMLKEKDYQVNVCTYQDNNFFKDDIESNGIVCTQIGNDKIPRHQLFKMLYSYFKTYKPEVVIAYLERPCMIASAFRLLGLKYKLIVSERNTNTDFSKQNWFRFQLFRIADYVVPNSHSQANFIKEHCPFLTKKIVTITNFCSFLDYTPQPKRRNLIPEILVAASIWPPKNTIGFIEAIRLLVNRNMSFHVSWYGLVEESDYYKQCKDLIVKYNIENYIVLLPKTKQLAKKYSEADYFCLPSFYEGTPNVLCEAICKSLPSICSNVCDNPIYVKEGENGFLFDPTSSEDIADKLKLALSLTDEEYEKQCIAGRKIAESTLSEDKFIEQYVNIL